MSFIAALDAELEALHNALATDPTFVKWRELQRIRGLYSQVSADVVLSGPSGMTVVQVKPTPVQQSPSRGEVDAGPRGRRPDPSRSRAVQEAETIIRAANGDPVPTSEILDKLQEQGISIPGERPSNNLSAILSNSGLFKANGRRGWTIQEDPLNADEGEGSEGALEVDDPMDFNDPIDDRKSDRSAYRTIATYVFENLDQEMKKLIRNVVGHGQPIPEDIERKLLDIGQNQLERSIDEAAMNAIRSEFASVAIHRERPRSEPSIVGRIT